MSERAGAWAGAYVRGRVRACAHERGGGEEGTAREQEEVVGSFHRLVSFRCRRHPSRCRVGGASSSSSRAEDIVDARSEVAETEAGERERRGMARKRARSAEAERTPLRLAQVRLDARARGSVCPCERATDVNARRCDALSS